MCRWFAYIGTEETLLEDVLIKPSHSLIRQIDSHFLPALHATYAPHAKGSDHLPVFHKATDQPGNPNVLTNVDGFGVAYYTPVLSSFDVAQGQYPCIYKSVRPPLNDLNLRSLARHTSTSCLFAHIRAAPGLTPVVETNCHPFVFGRYVFMHNGVVANFPFIKLHLLSKLSQKAHQNVLGTTDSEHAAALFFTHLGDNWDSLYSLTDLKRAMRATLNDLISLIEEFSPRSENNEPLPHSSLNFAVTDSTKLLAMRFSSTETHEPPSLYFSTTAGPTLNRKFPDHPDGQGNSIATKAVEDHGPHVIVASEPCTYNTKEWSLIPRNSLISVSEDMTVEIEDV